MDRTYEWVVMGRDWAGTSRLTAFDTKEAAQEYADKLMASISTPYYWVQREEKDVRNRER